MMAAAPRARRTGAAGFSLIELMVTVLVIGILSAIALPSYMDSVRKSRRTEARTALLDIAGREERFYNMNNSTYTASPTALGYSTFTPVGSGYYNVTVGAPVVAGVPTYILKATPVATSSQAQDLGCTEFDLDNTGLQTALGGDAANCWH
jgi:type IV pilus assembly protein PilE